MPIRAMTECSRLSEVESWYNEVEPGRAMVEWIRDK